MQPTDQETQSEIDPFDEGRVDLLSKRRQKCFDLVLVSIDDPCFDRDHASVFPLLVHCGVLEAFWRSLARVGAATTISLAPRLNPHNESFQDRLDVVRETIAGQ